MVGSEHSLNFSSQALTVWNRQCLEDYELKDESISELIDYLQCCFQNSPRYTGSVINTTVQKISFITHTKLGFLGNFDVISYFPLRILKRHSKPKKNILWSPGSGGQLIRDHTSLG